MSLLRSSIPIVRRTALPITLPAAVQSVRGYADKPEGEFSDAYRRGQSSGFQKKEQVGVDLLEG